MGLSETIAAAIIGAFATVTTALFQIFTSFKARTKVDTRPRRGNTFRSVLAVLVLMVASAAGGFLYSELLRQRRINDLEAIRQEIHALKEWTASAVQERERHAAFSSMNIELPPPTLDVPAPAGLDYAASDIGTRAYESLCVRSPSRPEESGVVCEEEAEAPGSGLPAAAIAAESMPAWPPASR